jgi:hypothetical protein
MVERNTGTFLIRNGYSEEVKNYAGESFEQIRVYMKENQVKEEQYAMMGHIQIADRMQKYMKDDGSEVS